MSRTSSAIEFRGRCSKYYNISNTAVWYSRINNYAESLKQDGIIRNAINSFFSKNHVVCIPRVIIERSCDSTLICVTSTHQEKIQVVQEALDLHIKKYYSKPYKLIISSMRESMNILYSIAENCANGLLQEPKKNPINLIKRVVASADRRYHSLLGVMVRLNGRIRGATIRSSVKYSLGNVPRSVLSKNVFDLIYPVQLPYGTNALRITIYYRPVNNNYRRYNNQDNRNSKNYRNNDHRSARNDSNYKNRTTAPNKPRVGGYNNRKGGSGVKI